MAREIVSWCDVCFNQDPPVNEKGTEVTVMIGKDKPRRVDLCEPHRKDLVDPLVTLLKEHGVTVDAPSPGAFKPVTPRPATYRGATGRPLNTPGGPACPVDDCTAGTGGFAHMDSLMVHTRRSHGMTRPNTNALYEAKGRPVWHPPTDDEVLQYDEPEPLPVDDNAMQTKSALTFADKKKLAVGMPLSNDPEENPDFVCGIDGCDRSYPPTKYQKPAQALGMHRAQKHGVAGTSKRSKNFRRQQQRREVEL